MSNQFDAIRYAVQEARDQLRAVDEQAANMAGLLVGRLRRVGREDYLRELKRELRDFDMTTGKWKKVRRG
jgi:hypothetical protein